MTGFEPQNFRITGETTKHLKNQKIIKDAQSTLVDGTPCQFHLEMNNGEPLNNVASKAMKIIFYDPFINPSEVSKTVEDELEMSDRTDIIQTETAFSTKKTNFVFIVNSPKEDLLKHRIRWQEALEHTLQTAM